MDCKQIDLEKQVARLEALLEGKQELIDILLNMVNKKATWSFPEINPFPQTTPFVFTQPSSSQIYWGQEKSVSEPNTKIK